MKVKIEKPTAKLLKKWDVATWPIWTKEPSTFDWHYDDQEMCYFLKGEITVDTPGGQVSFGQGDLVTFPKNLNCTWGAHQKSGEEALSVWVRN